MKLNETQTSDLNEIVSAASKIRGVTGIILFGSLARGDCDKYSDYDLLVLFENKTSMWQSWDELFQTVGNLKLNLHLIPETLEELKTANPTFQNELSKHGKILFARSPLEVFLQPVKLEPYSLISYNMSGLNYRNKMKAAYFLYRQNGAGAIAKTGGIKLNDGCILIPNSASEEITTTLSTLNVKTKKMQIYAGENSLKAWLDQKPTTTPEKPPINIPQ
jgi:predicted nucleotidyltransferase